MRKATLTIEQRKANKAASDRAYRLKNLDRLRARGRAYYWAHREESLERNRRWQRKMHPTVMKQREYNCRSLRKKRAMVVTLLGGKCVKCGIDDPRVLQFDHINGGGNKDRAKYKSTVQLCNHILDIKGKGFQLLCANCNWIKRHENREQYWKYG